jgi:hypothetical protein
MTLPVSRGDREYEKFTTDLAGDTAIRTTATISGDVNVESTNIAVQAYIGKPLGTNGDFVTTRTGAATFTCSTLPTGVTAIKTEDIETIRQINATGAVVATYSRDDATITCSGTDPTTVTVTGATFGVADTITIYTNIYKPIQADIQIGAVEIKNATDDTRATVNTANALKIFDYISNSLVPAAYDYIALTYTGSNLTGVVFKTGGAGGTTVSTLTLAYTGSQLDSITKT